MGRKRDRGLREQLIAAVDLIGRTGATAFEFGYLHDDVPLEEAGWFAHARYKGARIMVEDHPGPGEAVEALARRVLTGAKCRCGKLVALEGGTAVAYESTVMTDGSSWTLAEAAAAGECQWKRDGDRWVSACGARGRQ